MTLILLWLAGFLRFSQVQGQGTQNIEQQQSITRYEMVRLVEESTCNNCLTPPLSWKQKYSSLRLSQFQGLLGNSFDEIIREKARLDQKDYYYCVAHAGDQWWVNGYPRLTPGLCQGKFCGENNARGTELLQMIVNMIAPKVWNSYPVSFKSIKNRSVASWVVTDIESLWLINKWLDRCWEKPCIATNLDEFSLFMKYCSHHLEACGMQVIPPFVQWQWPIAELNVLYKANILEYNDPMIARLGSIINGSDLARFLPAIKQVTNCQTLDDYDGDALPNTRDNCPDTYNPHQSNLDQDAKGDVCDDDIDGDGSLNEIGLVDDTGRIIKKQKSWLDDCPLIPSEKLKNNECPVQEHLIAFDIQAEPVQVKPWDELQFNADVVGSIESLSWDFGDGNLWVGLAPSHRYQQAGSYQVQAYAVDVYGRQLSSQAQVIVDSSSVVLPTTVLTCASLTGTVANPMRCFLRFQWDTLDQATMLRWSWGDDSVSSYPENIKDKLIQEHIYTKPGTYTITTELYFWLEVLLTQTLVVYITGEEVCTASSQSCDLDKDTIPDQCDADIDGDGITNIIWLVTKDLPDCSFTLENIDTKILTDQITAIKKGVKYDNCSFASNADQADQNLDGIGDICESTVPWKDQKPWEPPAEQPWVPDWWNNKNPQPELPEDRDGDGLTDDRDGCIDIPENGNGVEDSDGCPELPKSCKPWSKCSGKAPNCTTCPCPWADYSSELWKGDRIRAVLLDEAGQVIYRYSPAEVIDVNIPDKMLGK
jgi:PKD domain/Thrombospondin type 3 repeat